MKKFESAFTRVLIFAALSLTVGIEQTGRGEEATQAADTSVGRATYDSKGAALTVTQTGKGSDAQLPAPPFLHVDRAQKPAEEAFGLPQEMSAVQDLARSVYRADSALPYPDPPASAAGPGGTTPKRSLALALGLNIEGNVFSSLGATTGYFTADRVANHRSSGLSGTLRLELWATTNSPAGGSVSGFRLITHTLGQLSAGNFFYNINSGTTAYTQPPTGCYYLSLLLTEFDGAGYPYVDYVVFPNLVTFRGGSCSGCTEDAFTMCLLGGRYRVTSYWRNQYAGGALSLLSKAKLTDATGAFWIANSSTFEYLIRFNTATNNGRAWVAIPTFTDVEFWVAVTDTFNGQAKEYHSSPGNQTLIYDPFYFVYP
ncbi:MAG: hypothetical protein PT977_15880 [Acidobacteriota bacterium]|nr:hypothetical protein [Acidobacteriota bacterium]